MKTPNIIEILEDIKIKIRAVAIGWDVVLMPENFKNYLPSSEKGAVFIGFRGINLGESSSDFSVQQFGEMAVQVSILSTHIYGDNGCLVLTHAITGALTGAIVDPSMNKKSYINAIAQIEHDESRGQWIYGIDFRLPVFLSE
jgi:hypothetical protein